MTQDTTTLRRKLADNLKRVRDRIAAACERARRHPADVTLIAVTKSVEIDVIRQTLECGVVHLGESRGQQLNQRAAMLQEFVSRRSRLGGADRTPPRPHWHMIGHLQRNKVKMILPWVDMIHSLDSLRLGEELHRFAEKAEREVDVLLQVNTSGERSKGGVAVAAVPYVIEHLRQFNRLKLRGLMTMAPIDAVPDEVRLYFNRLREVQEDLVRDGVAPRGFDQLSMGMSTDFEIAIECGATLVRVGSALYEGLATGPATAASADDVA